jgi:hypothetical protein
VWCVVPRLLEGEELGVVGVLEAVGSRQDGSSCGGRGVEEATGLEVGYGLGTVAGNWPELCGVEEATGPEVGDGLGKVAGNGPALSSARGGVGKAGGVEVEEGVGKVAGNGPAMLGCDGSHVEGGRGEGGTMDG